MKNIWTVLLFLFLINGCSPLNKENENNRMVKTSTQQEEDGEWELTVFDSDFDYFLASRARPKSMYTESYLKTRNQALASEWNSYYTSGRYRNIIESGVEYDPNEDYGFDFNYKLFQVFVYTSWKYHIRFYSLPNSERLR